MQHIIWQSDSQFLSGVRSFQPKALPFPAVSPIILLTKGTNRPRTNVRFLRTKQHAHERFSTHSASAKHILSGIIRVAGKEGSAVV